MIKLELNEEMVVIIGKVLEEAPYKISAPVLIELQKQIDAQRPKVNGKGTEKNAKSVQNIRQEPGAELAKATR